MTGILLMGACVPSTGGQMSEAEQTLQAIYLEQTVAALSQAAQETAEVEATSEPTPTIEIVHQVFPGEPGWVSQWWLDSDSTNTGPAGRASGGDFYNQNLLERPFTANDMSYRPDLDLIRVEISHNPTFYYFQLQLGNINSATGILSGFYGVEIDTDRDGRGDYLLWVRGDGNIEWNSTIAQMGYIILSVAIGLRNGSLPAIQSGFFILVAHACAKGLAFLSAGVFNLNAGIHEINDLRNRTNLPLFPVMTMGLAVLSLAALPPFPGFTGKWMVLTSLFQTQDPYQFGVAVILLAGSLIAFGYYLPFLVSLFSRLIQPSNSENKRLNESISPWLFMPLAFLVIAIVFITIFPQVILDGVAPVAELLLERMV